MAGPRRSIIYNCRRAVTIKVGGASAWTDVDIPVPIRVV
jgi:hypothetical protein